MKQFVGLLVLLVCFQSGFSLLCKRCHSAVEPCKEMTGDIFEEECMLSGQENVSCFEFQYLDEETEEKMVERGCWPNIWNPEDDPELCKALSESLQENMKHCNQCKSDGCNDSNLPDFKPYPKLF